MSAQWQYNVSRILAYDYEEIEQKLNEFGAEGWELVMIQYDQDDWYDATFKKQVA